LKAAKTLAYFITPKLFITEKRKPRNRGKVRGNAGKKKQIYSIYALRKKIIIYVPKKT